MKLDMVVHTWDSSMSEAEAGGSQFGNQAEPHYEILSQKKGGGCSV